MFEVIDASFLEIHFQPRVGRVAVEVAIIDTRSEAVNLNDIGCCEAQLIIAQDGLFRSIDPVDSIRRSTR